MTLDQRGIGMRILVREGDELIQRHQFDGTTITIGSDEACDVRFHDRRLAPKQAVLAQQLDSTWMIEPGDGGHPMNLNGRPVNEPTPVGHGDEIGLANYTIALYGTQQEERASGKTMTPAAATTTRQTKTLPPSAIVRGDDHRVEIAADALQRLACFSVTLGRCNDIPKLIEAILDAVIRRYGARSVYTGIRRTDFGRLQFVQGRRFDAKPCDEPGAFDLYLHHCLEKGLGILTPTPEGPNASQAIVAPLTCERGTVGLIYVERKQDAKPLTPADLDELVALASLAAAQLSVIVRDQAQVQEAGQAGQLSFLREVQTSMDPAKIPQWPGVQFAAYCKPGQERAGDVFDVMRLPNGLGACLVANIDGAPTRAALAMVEARASFRIGGLHADAANVLLRSANWMLCEHPDPCRMHATTVIMNPATGQIQLSSAGTTGAVIIDAAGDSRDLVAHDAPAAGSYSGFAYTSRTDQLQPGESLVLFTSGCHSVMNAAGTRLGEEAFVETLRDGFGQAANVALDELVQDLAAFFQHGRQPDDITILLFHKTNVSA
jgi:serine phosphatase RsbU (regulator of sigma subunit)